MTDQEASIQVTSFTDITDRLPSRESEMVARALNSGVEYVLVTEEWIAEENDLDAIAGESRIFGGERERTTEKAWLFATGQTAAWIPKSQSTLFTTDTETIKTPQQQLGAFARTQPPETEP